MVRAFAVIVPIVLACVAGDQSPIRVPTLTVDFLATTDDGQHAKGLTPAEISLKIGGRDRTVRQLEEVTVQRESSAARLASAVSSPLPPPYGETLRGADPSGRSILLVVDEGTLFGMENVLREAVATLVTSLSPADRLGVTSTRPDGVNVPLTTQHQDVRAAVDSLSLGRGNAFLCFGGVARQMLSLAALLPSGRGSTLVLLSRGGGVTNSQGPAVVGSGECLIRPDELRPIADLISSMQINYLTFHIGAAGISGTLDNLAGATGAVSSVLSFADASALAKAVRSATYFYRATIDADPGSGDRLERVELRVTRSGVRVKGPTHLSLEPVRQPIVDAASLLRAKTPPGDLPMRVAAFASKHEGPRPAKLLVILEAGESGTKLAEAIILLLSSTGEAVGRWTARTEDLTRSPLMAALPVMPGTYRVRVAAVDEQGRAGIADYTTETPQGLGDVKMSGLVLGVSPNGEFTPKLLFRDEPTAVAYLEVYNARPSADVDVTLELTASPDGPVFRKIPAQISAGQTQTAIAQIPLSGLPPGDTLVRAVVTVDGAPAGQTVRVLRKSGR